MPLHPPDDAHWRCTATPAPAARLWVPGRGQSLPTLASSFGTAVLAIYSRGFYRFPDKAVQEAKGKSDSPNDPGDISCYIAEIIFAISKH